MQFLKDGVQTVVSICVWRIGWSVKVLVNCHWASSIYKRSHVIHCSTVQEFADQHLSF